jgi:hypothetical protein
VCVCVCARARAIVKCKVQSRAVSECAINPVINPNPSIVTMHTCENIKESSDAVRNCYIMLTDLVLETAQESAGHLCVWKHCTAHFRAVCSNRKLALTVNRFLRKEVSRKPMRVSRSWSTHSGKLQTRNASRFTFTLSVFLLPSWDQWAIYNELKSASIFIHLSHRYRLGRFYDHPFLPTSSPPCLVLLSRNSSAIDAYSS